MEIDRRKFLAASAAAAGARGAYSAPQLAIDGGKPVRDKPLRADYWGPEYYDDKERRELLEVLETGRPFRWYGRGSGRPEKVATFEREFAARMQTKYALAVTSGTAALQTALAALGIGPGDEVILPAWTWHSCFNTIVHAGALPVFAEIDESFNIDPDDIEGKITPRTKLIMAVHLQGNPCDMDRVLAVARRRGIKVLEDCAQSVGASYKGRPLGSMGDIAIYSLQLNKTITAGEGGAVATSDPLLFERAARFHDLGNFHAVHEKVVGKRQGDWFIGTNFRMSEFTGGVLLAQLRKLDTIVGAVRANARQVYEGIQGLEGLRLRLRPDPAGELGSAVFLKFRSKELRDRYIEAMKAEGVPAAPPGGSVILPVLPHIINKVTVHPDWPSFTSERGRAIRYGPECCPRTLDILGRFAGVAMDPMFTARDIADVVTAIRKVYPRIVRAEA
ncbi:MAG: DegT/DnrJ/EryC1/StrS family aminotransferase [Rhodospirillales bacterium]